MNNPNTTEGTIATYVSPTKPSQDALSLFDPNDDEAENINGLGQLESLISLPADGYDNTILNIPSTQLDATMYITFIVTDNSIIEANLYIDKLYCSKSSSYAKGETSPDLDVDEIW